MIFYVDPIFWSALEAIGTIGATVVALFLGYRVARARNLKKPDKTTL